MIVRASTGRPVAMLVLARYLPLLAHVYENPRLRQRGVVIKNSCENTAKIAEGSYMASEKRLRCSTVRWKCGLKPPTKAA
jgi:hypothetical protein